MNPLTQVKRIQNLNSKEAALGISEEASWHAKYKESAYVYVGGIPFDLTEGDLLAVFAQYGEIVDVNLVRDKGTGKSKGFAFIAYEDQRSTNLAVDNLNGAQILGRIIRVDHVTNYKKKEEEDEETERQKREARGVCRAFQRGECTRGAGCKFSHDEQRAANSGWGAEEESRWGHDKFDGSMKSANKFGNERLRRFEESDGKQEKKQTMRNDHRDVERKSTKDHRSMKGELAFEPKSRENYDRRDEYRMREVDRKVEKRSRRVSDDAFQWRTGEQTYRMDEKRNRSEYKESQSNEDYETMDEKRRRGHESGAHIKHNHEKRGRDKSVSDRDSSY